MKKRGELELFGMAFLDVVACGFGAMIMLLLIAKNGEVQLTEPTTEKSIVEKVTLERKAKTLRAQLIGLEENQRKLAYRSADLLQQNAEIDNQNKKLSSSLAQKQSQLEVIKQQVSSTASSNSDGGQGTMISEFKAGIPVGAKHIIFVIDTSGSMRDQWSSLMKTVTELLRIHPKVSGFQVLSDNGDYLLRGYKRNWIPDTRSARNSALNALRNWSPPSNSSPAEGLTVALKTYAKPNTSLSVYVLGDDYTGSSYEDVLNVIARYNYSKVTGKRIASIHGIEFKPGARGDRFATLMREVAYRNNGVFLTL